MKGSLRERWAELLESSDPERGWAEFLSQYHRLVFSVARRMAGREDSPMDVYAHVCGELRRNGFRRLRRFDWSGSARFSTWLVTVVRNIAIDRYRRLHPRPPVPATVSQLTDLQHRIYELLVRGRKSYVEAFETLAAGEYPGLRFPEFLREVRELHASLREAGGPAARELFGEDPTAELTADLSTAPAPEQAADLERELSRLEPDVRRAVLLFVVEGVPAAEVARMVGWPGPKHVYNRVYRALKAMRRVMAERAEQTAAPDS